MALGEPVEVRGHRMQHSDAPTWCVDCGRFAPDGPCGNQGRGDFDQRKEKGATEILSSFAPPEARHA